MSKPINNHEPRITGIWEPTVKVRSKGPSASSLKRKVVTERTMKIAFPMSQVAKLLRQGYEIVLTDDPSTEEPNGIRLFHCMNTKLTEMFVAAQSVGDFRHSISDVGFKVVHNRQELSPTECRQMVDATVECHEENKREAACPTRVVQCPKCGYEFEIGGLKAK